MIYDDFLKKYKTVKLEFLKHKKLDDLKNTLL